MAVTIEARTDMPGFRASAGCSNSTLTLKKVTSGWSAREKPELPTSTTLPAKVSSGMASTASSASCPTATCTISVSSTSTTASTSERSARVAITDAGLFIVPETTTSPSSALRSMTRPEIGA